MGFLNKAFRKGMKKQVAQMPRRGGGFGNLGEAIRRLQEKRGGDMGMPRMPSITQVWLIQAELLDFTII
jgi:hypothetical protein